MRLILSILCLILIAVLVFALLIQEQNQTMRDYEAALVRGDRNHRVDMLRNAQKDWSAKEALYLAEINKLKRGR